MEVPIIQQHKCQGKKKGNYLGQHSTIIQHWILCWAARHTPASRNTKLKQELWIRHSGDNRELWLVRMLCFKVWYQLSTFWRNPLPTCSRKKCNPDDAGSKFLEMLSNFYQKAWHYIPFIPVYFRWTWKLHIQKIQCMFYTISHSQDNKVLKVTGWFPLYILNL